MSKTAAIFLLITLFSACSSDNSNGQADSAIALPFDGYNSELYSSSENWLCHPSLTDEEDVCSSNLDNTRVYADGSTEVEPFTRAPDPQVDCFYVYPTYSTDEGDNSDMQEGPGEIYATLSQAARYSQFCRVFAPVYRQTTIGALFSGGTPDFALAYVDVLDSFKHYIANDNRGRGFILIGHSQGSSHLRRLIAEVIETDDYLLDHMISAHLLGTSVNKPEGVEVGSEFRQVPVCRTADQTGCLVSYATFRSTDPFLAAGQVRFGAPLNGEPAICSNPAALTGGSANLSGYFPLAPDPVLDGFIIKRAAGPFADPANAPLITTPFYSMPDLITGKCVVDGNGTSYLEATVHADPSDPRADDVNGEFRFGNGFGLHLVDMTLALGDLVTLGAAESEAWLQDR